MKYLVIATGKEYGNGLVRLGYYADYETARELAETICRINKKAVETDPIVVKIECQETFDPDEEASR